MEQEIETPRHRANDPGPANLVKEVDDGTGYMCTVRQASPV